MDAIDKLRHRLRDEYRLKEGTDYALTYKYGELRILLRKVGDRQTVIAETAADLGLSVKAFFTY